MTKWAAGYLYDNGNLGKVGIYGLASREAAIKWLEDHPVDWKRDWFMMPSCWIKEC